MIKPYYADNVLELPVKIQVKTSNWDYVSPEDRGKSVFERCIENPWIEDKVSQVSDVKNKKLFDFGCNKAQYILNFKEKYNIKTYGIDAKKDGRDFVDHFFHGLYDDDIEKNINKSGPYDIVTAISAVEHAGHDLHPNADEVTEYQQRICKNLINISDYFFLTVPYGRRPGWAKDQSRMNLYQFNNDMLDFIHSFSLESNRSYMEEIYALKDGLWRKSSRDESGTARYRSNKLGASAIALISVWK